MALLHTPVPKKPCRRLRRRLQSLINRSVFAATVRRVSRWTSRRCTGLARESSCEGRTRGRRGCQSIHRATDGTRSMSSCLRTRIATAETNPQSSTDQYFSMSIIAWLSQWVRSSANSTWSHFSKFEPSETSSVKALRPEPLGMPTANSTDPVDDSIPPFRHKRRYPREHSASQAKLVKLKAYEARISCVEGAANVQPAEDRPLVSAETSMHSLRIADERVDEACMVSKNKLRGRG